MENDPEHMRIEDLFSGIERQTSQIFIKIRNAAKEKLDHVNILEKNIHILFRFMILSPRRSKQYRDEMQNPYRENDFMFQRLFEASRKEGRSSDPGEVWLEQILYLLKASHEDLPADAEHPGDSISKASARTYKHFVQNYALQIWHAADGYEFFLNESLCGFESDTQSFLAAEHLKNEPGEMAVYCNDGFTMAERVVEAIQNAAQTGRIGDGKIFVTTIDTAVRIRTGERDADAV